MKYNKSKLRHKPYKKLRSLLPVFMALIMFITLAGCGKAKPAAPIELPVAEGTFTEASVDNEALHTDSQEPEQATTQEMQQDTAQDTQQSNAQESGHSAEQDSASQDTEQDTAQESQQAEVRDTSQDLQQTSTEAPLIDEDGVYTTKEDVALYIHTYGKLPSNFITKKAAKKLGWSGGSLEDYAPGKCIGGDYFGNYEGLLPEDKEYHECDIDTLGKSKRGAKRIIYSDDGYIYYTGDHYETFELLYEP